ncbi:hypothetical protein HK104_004562 [Borealophlyctis nickersoniae]|nr:hypothetical protein HK104_004562 [Borealophlyctis nickersoniae]
MHSRHYNAGDVVIKEGDPAKAMFFVVKGTVKVISADGEINFAELNPGNFFGEIGIMFHINRTATVIAKTKCLVAALTAEALEAKTALYPEIQDLIKAAAQERYRQWASGMEKAGRRVHGDVESLHEKKKEDRRDSHGSIRDLSLSRMSSRPSEVDKELSTIAGHADGTCQVAHSAGTASEDFSTAAMSIASDAAPPPSTNSVTQSSPPSESSLPILTPVAALSQKYGSRRRASVAVWSDDRLMQFANAAAAQAEHSKEKYLPKSSSILSRTSTDASISLDRPPRAAPTAPPQTPGYGCLGREIMIRIFRKLDFRQQMRVRLASMVLLRLLLDPDTRLTTEVDLSPWHKRIDDTIISNVVCFCGPTVRKLNLRGCWQVTDKGLAAIAHYAPNIEVLCLASVWDVTDAGVANMARMCHMLKELDLSNCRKLSDAGVVGVLDGCPKIESLCLSYCKNLSDGVMEHPRWAEMKKVNFQRCTGIFDAGFERWKAVAGKGVAHAIGADDGAMDLSLAEASAEADDKVEEEEGDGRGAGQGVAENHADDVESPAGSRIQPSPMEKSVVVDDVEVFDLEFESDETIVHPSNTEQNQHQNGTNTGGKAGGVEHPASTLDDGLRVPGMLGVTRTSPEASVDMDLDDFDEDDEDEARDTLPPSLPTVPNPFALEELILSDCSFLTDATVAAVAGSCPNLIALSLSFCCALTESFAPHLAQGCPRLRMLDLSFCGGAVTDPSLLILARGLRRLERLSIRGCVQVTPAGIEYIAEWCEGMRMVNVSQCRGIGPDSVAGKGWKLLTCQTLLEVEDDDRASRVGRRERDKNGVGNAAKKAKRDSRSRASTA